jgi:hypothetical protein
VAIFVGSTSERLIYLLRRGNTLPRFCMLSSGSGRGRANGPARKDVWKEREAIIQNEVIIGFSLAWRERFPYNPVDSLVPLARRHWHSARLQDQFEKVNLMNLILAQEAGK